MPVRLISLKGVLDDEAEELRALLHVNKIEYYETSGGNWGISTPAIWLHDKRQLERARTLIEKYQAERFSRVRGEYEALKRAGKSKTIIDAIKENPGQFIIYIIFVVFIIYLSFKPFIDIGKQ